MVRLLRKNVWVTMFTKGVLVFGMVLGYLGALHTEPAFRYEDMAVYTFDLNEERTGWTDEDSYQISGVLTVLEDCDIGPLIVQAVISPGAAPVDISWRDLDGRSSDESRGPSEAPLNLELDLPKFFFKAYVKTSHICPASDSEEADVMRQETGRVFYTEVITTLYHIEGNVVERQTVSSSEVVVK